MKLANIINNYKLNRKRKREELERAYTIYNKGVCSKCIGCGWLICELKTITWRPGGGLEMHGMQSREIFDKDKPSFCGYDYVKNEDRKILEIGCSNFIKSVERR